MGLGLALISLGLIGSLGGRVWSAGMTLLEFEPTREYAHITLAQEDVKKYIGSRSTHMGSPPLYMVVGVIIAHGAGIQGLPPLMRIS